MTAGTTTIE